MSYSVSPVEEDRCVVLSYEGETPPLEVSASRSEADHLLEQRHWNRLVIDVTRLHARPKTSVLFDFARKLSSQICRKSRVAMVVRPEQARDAKLVEKAARNGRVFLTYFVDSERALAWLRRTAFRETLRKGASDEAPSLPEAGC